MKDIEREANENIARNLQRMAKDMAEIRVGADKFSFGVDELRRRHNASR